MTDPTKPLPALRALDIVPFRNERNEPYFALQDMLQIAPKPAALSLAGYFVAMCLDGQRTLDDVQLAFVQQFGHVVQTSQLEDLIATLDELLLLQNDRFEQAYAERRAAYQAAAVRDNRERWPDRESLRSEIEEMLAGGTAHETTELVGLITPHLDYQRGTPCYADAYATLAKAAPAERYVILGTNHHGRSPNPVATNKDFQTPLGLAPVDRAFVERIEHHLGESITKEEFDHAFEHSVDSQVHVLQVCQPDTPFTIVPVLCPDPTAVPDGTRPTVAEFADALAKALTESDNTRTVVIASADLSHVGRRFGDEEQTTPEIMAEVGRHDRALLDLLEANELDGFLSTISATSNHTKICSCGCLYALLRALPGQACHVLGYHQATDFEAETSVTCAAGVVG